MSVYMSLPVSPDDPEARAIVQAYENTIASEGVHAAYDAHFVDDCWYFFHGNSPLAGRHEGKEGLKAWWDGLIERVDPDLECIISMASDGIVVNIDKATFVNRRGERLETKIVAVYGTRDGKMVSCQISSFDQEEFDKLLS